MKTPTILAIIPARGGSKGLPGKNIFPINGKPLLAYTIEAALNASYITKTVVSSDDDKILKVSENYGAVGLRRPSQYATDTASSESVIKHALYSLEEKGDVFNIIVLLQPTSPLRNSEDIDEALELMLSKNAEAVTSVTNIGKKPFKSYYKTKEGFLKGIYNDEAPNMRRQDLPDAFLANGAIYAVYTEVFLKINSFLPKTTIPYIMNENKSVDVDSVEDIKKAERLMKKKKLK